MPALRLPFAPTALLLVLVPAAAPAQEAREPALDDVVVTAERTPGDLQHVPGSVTVVTGERLAGEGAGSLVRIGASVPNLYLNRNFGTASGALSFLRGVGEGDSIFTNDPPVGIYVDDVLLPRSTGALLDLLDIDRIEVSRGPQGTLFGRNTSGGAIRVVTRDPDPAHAEAVVEGTLGSYARADLKGTLNLPLGDRAALRVSAMTRNADGWGRNLTDGARVNGQAIAAGRAVLGWTAGELSVRASADYADDRSGVRFPQRFRPDPQRAGRYLPEFVEPDGDIDHFVSADTDPLNRTRSGGASLRLQHPAGAFTLTALTGYRALRSRIGFDQTANPPGAGANVILLQDQRQHSWSQEMTLAGPLANGVTLVAGAYAFREHNRQLTAVSFADPRGSTAARYRTDDFFIAPSRVGTTGTWSPYEPRLDTRSWSAFASLTATPAPRLSLTAGARFTHERKRYAVRFLTAPDTVLVLADGRTATRRIGDRWTDLSPRVAASYALATDATAYVSVAKGFRSGSFDGRARNVDFVLNRQQAIAPERVWSREAGVKTEWLGQRLRLNVAYFINSYRDIAFSAARAGSSPPEIFRQNVGDARIQGLEAELTARPTRSLDVGAVLGTLSDRLTRLASSPGCTTVADERDLDLRFTPARRWSVRGRWRRPLGGGTVDLGGDYAGSSPYNIALCNEPQHRVDDFEQFNASAGYSDAAGRWRVTLAVSNVTDRRYNTGSVGTIGYPAEPRQWTASIARRF